ncbi:secretion protein [Porphyromonas gingivalis]|uniref:T9SS type A sorting domain-containing protein n=1 Tax=Porphyromonas gingivalis TaxID=837 RepID=UPI000C1906A2|nr:T9SS type A sorting domain-containing protein [Porphyromonas gingivalis]ATR90928.1 secretion protein [Porphyromonas gingivalis]
MKKTTIISLIAFGAFFAAVGQTKDNSSYKPFSKEDIAGGVYSLPTQNRAQKDNAEWLLTATVSTNQSADTHFIFDENNRYIARDTKANGVRKSTDSIYYDANGRISHVDLYISFGGGEPALDTRFKYTYDDEGKMTVREVFMLVMDPNTPISRLEYHYDAQGRLTHWISFAFGAESQKNTYHYNEKGLLVSEVLSNAMGTTYSDTGKTEYSYDDADNMVKAEYFVVQQGKAWQVLKREEYTYEDNICIQYLAINGTDTKVYKRDIESDKSISANVIDIPSMPEQTWPNMYGFNAKRLKETYSSYEGDVATPIFDYIYTYKALTSMATPSTEAQVAVYLNPSTDRLVILANGITHLSMYDLQGKLVRDCALSGDKVEMGVGSLAKGTYLLKVNTDQGAFVRKVVIR